MSLELKIKAKSLAAEAAIIRKEERKQLSHSRYCRRTNHADPEPSLAKYNSLRNHRTGIVRDVARQTGIARAFLRGVPYKTVEDPKRKLLILSDMKAIAKMAATYGPDSPTSKDVEAWVNK